MTRYGCVCWPYIGKSRAPQGPRTSPSGITLSSRITHPDFSYNAMPLRRYLLLSAVLVGSLAGVPARAAPPAPFDLAGPTLEAKITRGGITLPASEVPNLAVGDRIWIRADLPPTQSAHYLLVAAFLTGSTNPPPDSWFSSCKTWKARCGSDGLTVTVPQYAQQVMLFLAPETNADFSTLVNAVRGRPGAFV